MKIISLSVENFKKIKAMEMEPTERGLTPIKGKNRQGKTSILDALEALFKGRRMISDAQINNGHAKGKIKVALGNGNEIYEIERVIRRGKNPLLKIYKDGEKITKKPESFVKSLVNELSFNPKPFQDKNDKEKMEFLIELMEIDFSEIDEKIDNIYQKRRDLKRDLKKYSNLQVVNKVEVIDVSAENEKRKKVSQKLEATKDEYREKVQKLSNSNNKLEQLEKDIQQNTQTKEDILEQIKELQERVEIIDRENEKIEERVNKGKNFVEKLENKIRKKYKVEGDIEFNNLSNVGIIEKYQQEVDEIDEVIAVADEKNKKAYEYKEYKKAKKEKRRLNTEVEELSEEIEFHRNKKKRLLAEKEMPVKGLELVSDFDDRPSGVYYNGVHSSGWSDSEERLISAKLYSTMQPELKAMFLDQGEVYDKESLAELQKWAEESDVQVFITICSDENVGEEKDAFYIVEGEIVE